MLVSMLCVEEEEEDWRRGILLKYVAPASLLEKYFSKCLSWQGGTAETVVQIISDIFFFTC